MTTDPTPAGSANPTVADDWLIVTEALEAAGWTGADDNPLEILEHDGATWAIANDCGDSGLSKDGWTVEFPSDTPVSVVIAACLAAVGHAPARRVLGTTEQADTAAAPTADPADGLAAGLRAAADEIAGIDFHPNARARSLDIATGLVRRLRQLADEAQQPTSCGRPAAMSTPCSAGDHCCEGGAEAQQPTPAPAEETKPEPTATLVINRSDSYCDGCGKPTLYRHTHHTDISGWTPHTGGGCGARFTAMRSDYRGITADQLKDLRPDLPVVAPADPATPAPAEETR